MFNYLSVFISTLIPDGQRINSDIFSIILIGSVSINVSFGLKKNVCSAVVKGNVLHKSIGLA